MEKSTDVTRYLMHIPNDVMNQIRMLSAERKVSNDTNTNKTQKSIIIELLEIGLLSLKEKTKETTNNTNPKN